MKTLTHRNANNLREFPSKKLPSTRNAFGLVKPLFLLLLTWVFFPAHVGGTQAQQNSVGLVNVVSGKPTTELGQEVKATIGFRMAQAGQADYAGEFYRVGGRKIKLLRSLDKIAVRYLPNEGFSVMNQLQAMEQWEGEFHIDHEISERGITVLQTSKFESLDELDESIRQLEQTPGTIRAVPVYIHEESGLELIATEEFIVKLAAGAGAAELKTINEVMGATVVRPLAGTTDQFVLTIGDCRPEELLAVCEAYWRDPAIEWAEPDFLAQAVKFEIHPNDSYYDDYLWHLPDIDAPSAWDITTGSDQICIAIIDDGMKLTHEDLAANLFTKDL